MTFVIDNHVMTKKENNHNLHYFQKTKQTKHNKSKHSILHTYQEMMDKENS